MKHKLLLISLSVMLFLMLNPLALSQVWPPEGMNMPGDFNNWTNPPYINSFAGIQKTGGTFLVDASLATRRYRTTIHIDVSGADTSAGTYQWLFTSGPVGGYSNNKWSGVTVVMNTVQTYIKEDPANNTITLSDGKYYNVNFKDNGYANTDAIWMETSAQPVTISSVTQLPLPGSVTSSTPVAVTVTLNTSKSAEENVYVRYTTDNWASSTLAEVSFIGASGTATIPAETGGTSVKYYIFSTTLTNPTSNYDLVTISHDNNSGLNYSYIVSSPTYSITAAAGINGTINPSGSVIVADGDDTTFTITPDPGYYIDSLIVDDVSVDTASSYTFINVIMNHSIRAVFTKNVNLTFQVDMKMMMRNSDFIITSGDQVTVRGEFNNWGNAPGKPDTLDDLNNDSIYTKTISIKENKSYQYKFWKTYRSGLDYESSTNHTLLTGTSDSTLAVIYFNNADVNVTYSVDMRVQIRKGNFLPELGDVVSIPGTHNGWQTGTTLSDLDNDSIYTKIFAVESNRSHEFKFWKTLRASMDWESSSNRIYDLGGSDMPLPTYFFNNEMLSVDVTFQVDMSIQIIKGLFNPSIDAVLVRGSFNGWGTPDTLTDPNYDEIYSKTISIQGGQSIEYKYWKTDIDNDKGYENILTNRTSDLTMSDLIIDPVYFSNDGSYKTDVSVTETWNMISLPRVVADSAVTTLFPTAISDAFKFTTQYISVTKLENSLGYWLKFSKDTTFSIIGRDILVDSINITNDGWNLIGSITEKVPVSTITTDPLDILKSDFFCYSGSYQSADTLEPGKAYWIKSGVGKIVLQQPVVVHKILAREQRSENLNQIIIKDARGTSQKLFLAQKSDNIFTARYELPPLPPAGAFDVRFRTNRSMEMIESNQQEEIPVDVKAEYYPLTIEWKINSSSSPLVITVAGKDIPMTASGAVKVTGSDSKISIKSLVAIELPKQFSIEPNYPNPFNPTTSIKYALPVDALISIKIYDELGQDIITLLNEVQTAGYKTVEWNSLNHNNMPVASGIYFYTIRAAGISDIDRSFTHSGKMVLVK
jgi:hypothetical protein